MRPYEINNASTLIMKKVTKKTWSIQFVVDGTTWNTSLLSFYCMKLFINMSPVDFLNIKQCDTWQILIGWDLIYNLWFESKGILLFRGDQVCKGFLTQIANFCPLSQWSRPNHVLDGLVTLHCSKSSMLSLARLVDPFLS